MAEGPPKTHVLDEAVSTTELSMLGELLTMRSVQNLVNKYLDIADKSFRKAGKRRSPLSRLVLRIRVVIMRSRRAVIVARRGWILHRRAAFLLLFRAPYPLLNMYNTESIALLR
jgi:hypothetical protein